MADLVEESDAAQADRARPAGEVDLGTQLEDIITHIFHCEAWQRVEDRIDLAVRILPESR